MPSTLPSLIVEVTTDKPALPTVIWFYFHISNICSNRKKKMGEISPYFVRLALLSLLIWKQILFFFQDIIHLPPPPLNHAALVRRPHWAPVQRGTWTAHTVSLTKLTHSLPGESGGTIGKEPTSLFYNPRCWRPHIPWAVQVLPGHQVRANLAWIHTWDCQSQNSRRRVVRGSFWGAGQTNMLWDF